MGQTPPKRVARSPLNRDLAALKQWWNQQVQSVLDHVLSRDEHGPQFRFQALMAFMAVVWLTAALVEHPVLDTSALLEGMPGFVAFLVSPIIVVVAALFHLDVLRHLVVPLIMILLGLRAGAKYLQDLFELDDPQLALNYLVSAMFGGSYSSIEIKDGLVTEASKESALYRIGGPGYVKIHLGNAALFERPGGESIIYRATSGTFVHGFERLREVVDLRDQIRRRDDMLVYTKDGIPVKVTDVQVAFRLWSGGQPRSKDNPYPLDDVALRRVVYGKSISAGFRSAPWTESIAGMASGVVTRYIGSRLLKDIIAQKSKVSMVPPGHQEAVEAGVVMSTEPVASLAAPANARRPLSLSFYDEATAKRFEAAGVELIWIGVGTIETPEDVSQELINAWQADATAKLKSGQFKADDERRKARSQTLERLLVSISEWWQRATFQFYPTGRGRSAASSSSAEFSDRSWASALLVTEEQMRARDMLRMYSIKLQELYDGLKGQTTGLPEKTKEALDYIRRLSSPTVDIGDEAPAEKGKSGEASRPAPEAQAGNGSASQADTAQESPHPSAERLFFESPPRESDQKDAFSPTPEAIEASQGEAPQPASALTPGFSEGEIYWWNALQNTVRVVKVVWQDSHPRGVVLERTDGQNFPTGPQARLRADVFRQLVASGELVKQN